MNKAQTMLMIAAAFAPTSQTAGCRKNQPRTCLNCGSLHSHNNAFCSAKCCTEHRDINVK